jgi:hypothetical protein
LESLTNLDGGEKMIRLNGGIYLCSLNGHQLMVVYKGNNSCHLYFEDQYKGTSPFDYVKKQLSELEKTWNTIKIKDYDFKEYEDHL